MEHTKGNWDLSSNEFKERNTLGKILLLDAKSSEIGVAINDLKKRYIKESCKLKEGQKIKYIYYTDRWMFGCVSRIRYDLHDGFVYYIDKYTKNWERVVTSCKSVKINHCDLTDQIFKDSVKIESLIGKE